MKTPATEYVDVPEHYRVDYCMTANDNGMKDCRILKGDTLYIRVQDTVESGQVAVIVIDEAEPIVRRVYWTATGGIILTASHEYGTLSFNRDERHRVQIIGRVTQVAHDIIY